jgi:NAD+ kinase
VKLGLVLHPSRQSALDAARAIVEDAARRGMHIMTPGEDVDRLPGAAPWEAATESADAIIAVGGDGTMLEAARIARTIGAPIVGVNVGTVGFLTEIDPGRVSEMLDRLASGRYTVSERLTLRARLDEETAVDALNDVVTEKAVSQHVVGIGVSIDDEPFTEYRADAVIVATPTGSTAYTFSAGGPLVDPDVEAIVVTPVAPHNLFGRSMVLAGSSVIDLTIIGDRPARVHADGRALGTLGPGRTLRVQAGPYRDRIIRMDPPSFARTVTEKFRTGNAR